MPLSFSPPMLATSLLVQYLNCGLWTALANLLGITLHRTSAFNPAPNGMVGCFHPTLKAALISCCKDFNLFTPLPWVFLGLRTTPKDSLDLSAAEMVHGDPLVIPAKIFAFITSFNDLQHLRHVVGKFTPCHQTYKPPAKHHIPTDLYYGTNVFLRIDTSKLQ
ncbi:uncharacterized protein [Palaemon carinicauda]|uniref:uncharacterized protein n=1 Tax=Palaemon carinicauda TaxID=392227 RepID=UPI0035B68F83